MFYILHETFANATDKYLVNLLQIYYKITIQIVQQPTILFMNSVKLLREYYHDNCSALLYSVHIS